MALFTLAEWAVAGDNRKHIKNIPGIEEKLSEDLLPYIEQKKCCSGIPGDMRDLEQAKRKYHRICIWNRLYHNEQTISIIYPAIRLGYVDLVEYVIQNRKPLLYEDMTHTASSYGNLECLRYLHENGCPWNSYTILYAAANGRIECVKYLHENGCPWNSYATFYAFSSEQWECAKYLREQGCLKK